MGSGWASAVQVYIIVIVNTYLQYGDLRWVIISTENTNLLLVKIWYHLK